MEDCNSCKLYHRTQGLLLKTLGLFIKYADEGKQFSRKDIDLFKIEYKRAVENYHSINNE